MATPAYRNLLRATRIAFQGDDRVLLAARQQIGATFRADAQLTDQPTIQAKLKQAHEMAEFLKANVVQGKKEENGTYRLRIHEHTERGDNDSIKLAAGGKTVSIGGGCCSS